MHWDWNDIADYISKVEGKPISRSRCQQIAKTALRKLRKALEEDPDVRDYFYENPTIDTRTMKSIRPKWKEGDDK